MAYDNYLEERLRNHLMGIPQIIAEEKRMFGGLDFMVNEKMCINVSKERLMCRFERYSYCESKREKE